MTETAKIQPTYAVSAARIRGLENEIEQLRDAIMKADRQISNALADEAQKTLRKALSYEPPHAE